MIIDAARLPDGSSIEGDLVIIGGGIVALTLARELAATGAEIVILESGGMSPTPGAQALYEGTGRLSGPAGAPRDLSEYVVRSRVRWFGGSGNVWGGKCGVLEAVDFERRSWIPNSGWPLSRSDLDPFYRRACQQLEIPDLTQPMPRLTSPARPALPLRQDQALVTQARFHTAFTGARGDRYTEWKDGVTGPSTIRVYHDATVTSINLTPDGRRVAGLTVRCLDGRRHTATGRRYVLATGGLENVRLLLQSNDVQRDGIGNARGLVGTCFSGHINFALGEGRITGVAFTRRSGSFALYVDPDLHQVWGIVGTTRSAQQAHRLPNFWGTFSPLEGDPGASVREGSSAWRALDGGTGGADFQPIRFMAELEAQAGSRVTLAETRDALGQPRLHLEWKLTGSDIDGLNRSIRLFAATLGGERLGRLRWGVADDQLIGLANPARHHLGTTRMHRDPAHGVVDADCRVHDVGNLYIGGSSVFPTGGVANPTLTIMAMTLRLSDHLRPVVRS